MLLLLYIQFPPGETRSSLSERFPSRAIGGMFALFITHTSFSISAAVGFTSLTGVATLGAVVFLSGIRRAQREEGPVRGLEKGCLDEMRPVTWHAWLQGWGFCRRRWQPGLVRKRSSRWRA